MTETQSKYLFVEDIAEDLEETDLRKVRRWITEEMPHERHGHRVKVLRKDYKNWKACASPWMRSATGTRPRSRASRRA